MRKLLLSALILVLASDLVSCGSSEETDPDKTKDGKPLTATATINVEGASSAADNGYYSFDKYHSCTKDLSSRYQTSRFGPKAMSCHVTEWFAVAGVEPRGTSSEPPGQCIWGLAALDPRHTRNHLPKTPRRTRRTRAAGNGA